ncbi:MAG: phosphoribosylformylglycinamidine synthase subunit PurS, partial [Actinobacteria bacterium]|nr:phosphoribosylformylglycinamidine synthase subunit PurS [Actinomycetota bacterium]
MIKVNVYVTLKKEILDTQGLVIKNAIPQIGFNNVENVRFGKFIQL